MHSDLITPAHLSRHALIYVRKSTPHQVLGNQESLRLQHAQKRLSVKPPGEGPGTGAYI